MELVGGFAPLYPSTNWHEATSIIQFWIKQMASNMTSHGLFERGSKYIPQLSRIMIHVFSSYVQSTHTSITNHIEDSNLHQASHRHSLQPVSMIFSNLALHNPSPLMAPVHTPCSRHQRPSWHQPCSQRRPTSSDCQRNQWPVDFLKALIGGIVLPKVSRNLSSVHW